jgi:hypothetical protein
LSLIIHAAQPSPAIASPWQSASARPASRTVRAAIEPRLLPMPRPSSMVPRISEKVYTVPPSSSARLRVQITCAPSAHAPLMPMAT